MIAGLEKREAPAVRTADVPPPAISSLWVKWFTWYARQYLRRHFHTLRIARGGFPEECHGFPVVVYLNHPSWWDPLVCAFLKNEFFPDRQAYAPIDQDMLDRYRFFRRIGFFGVDGRNGRSAAQFLRTSAEILKSPRNILFITPQSRFVDVRERPLGFTRGLGHLAAHLERAIFLPLAIEYAYWEERFPEILVRFGPATVIQPQIKTAFDPSEWTRLFESKLAEIQDRLADLSQFRDPADFRILLRGGSGVSVFYDLWRSARARFKGESFRKDHGQI